jgi:nanoRNase/pAp phosphatase (c-di-AMP/oligoRNAs hydrolase)
VVATEEEKQQYEAQSKVDKARYTNEMADYRGGGGAHASGMKSSDGESD